MVYRFTRVTRVFLFYKFGEMFFLIELNFFIVYFFLSHIVKNIVLDKIYVIKLYKIHEHIHRFDSLTWFTSLTSLTFF
jgi:hypothetical protein